MRHKTFSTQVLRSPKPGRWNYVIWPESAAFFGTRGLVKVKATVDGLAFEISFLALGDGNHKLPIRGEILPAIGKNPGDTVTVTLLERLPPVRSRKTRR